jgi:predicted  nucleic acid-binding Zn-ribbon protein/ribonuclease HI
LREIFLTLIKLQELDLKIKEINQKLKAKPEAISVLRAELANIEQELKLAKNELVEKEKNKREAEWELEGCETQIKKSKQKMMAVKTNKEYQALLLEIDAGEKIVLDLEEKILNILGEIELTQKNVGEKEEKLKELEQRLNKAQKQLEVSFTNLKKELITLRQERQKILKIMPNHLLRQYDFILGHRNGLAVAAVKDGVCEGCHMQIPPQKYNELLRGDKIMTCPACQRIIYWKGLLEENKDNQEAENKNKIYSLYADGASRGNPGKAGAGIVILDPDGKVISKKSIYLGEKTNNEAEYMGLIFGLKEACQYGIKELHILIDTQLVVNHLKGVYKVRANHLKTHYNEAKKLLEHFSSYEVFHIKRGQNQLADKLANLAIEEELD